MNQEQPEFGWWLKIVTAKPLCIYYFGVFESQWAAESLKNGYIQDLQEERAKMIEVQIQQCQPKQLTIEEPEIKANQELSQYCNDREKHQS